MRAILCVALFGLASCDSTPPRPLVILDDPGPHAWSSISVDGNGACALDVDGAAYCWGLQQVCTNQACSDPVPRRLVTPVRFSMIDLGSIQGCGLSTTREVYCWGAAHGPSLGDGVTKSSVTPVRVAFNRPVKTVSVGFAHACLLDDQGTAYCWGDGVWALGDGIDSNFTRQYSTPSPVATTLKFESIAAGVVHTCAIDVNQAAYCWGTGAGALGVGARDTACASGPSCFRSAKPELVDGGLRWKSLSVASQVTCGVTTDGRGFCWGSVGFTADVLGAGDSQGSKSPRAVAGGLSFQSISTSGAHTCGITLDGAAYCWGDGLFGQLGTGQVNVRFNTPQQVIGALRFQSIGARDATCGISTNHNAYCWGPPTAGQLGNGVADMTVRAIPTRVTQPAP
jgi:alpha-tubulin suppressor-like RCC1 family protein